MDFSKYKNSLLQYLQYKGIEAQRGLIRCFNPQHEDKNPSCELFEDHFKCYSCGIHGDIYDAVEILQGITDKAEQFKEIERTFGGASTAPVLPKKSAPKTRKTEDFATDPDCVKKLEDYFKRHKSRNEEVTKYLNRRAQIKTNNQLQSYPVEVRDRMVSYFFYWPGYTIAEAELGWQTLVGAGIPGRNPEKGNKSLWEASGVVFKGFSGFKLNYYLGGKSNKVNTKGISPFPMPGLLPKEKPVVFVEGEFDAIACRAAGIENVFSTCGVNGLTEPKAQEFIIPNNIPEITFFADKDNAQNNYIGQKMFGLMPFAETDKYKTSIPEKLLKAGFKGQIKVAILPDNVPYKDTDEAILAGHADLVIEAIKNAQLYKTPEVKKEIHGTLWLDYDTLSIKRLRSLLKKVEYNSLDEEDTELFALACVKACKNKETINEILKWGEGNITVKQLEKKSNITPYFILEICEKYGVSNYLRRELEKALIPASEILRNIKEQQTIVSIDYDKMENDVNFLQFLNTQEVRSAALTVASVLQGRLIYVECEKRWYFFNGHVWVREPDAPGAAYTILLNLMLKYLEKHFDKKSLINDLVKKLEGRRFRVELAQDLSGLKPDVFRENVPFDGPQMRETLTLLDCVVDFSGKEIEYRKSRPEEYRREMLPYKEEELRKAGKPEKFLEFMKGNFKDEKTLQTLLYYLSLIPSRNTGFKYGGIFLGKGGTGKSTTCNIVEEIFKGMCARVKSDVLVSTGFKRASGNEANPEIAKLEGKCCAFAQETARNASLNTSFWKELTGGDTLTARGLYRDPHDFIPTAQIIIASNYSPNFDAHDEAAISRMVVIPFNIQHKKGEGGKTATGFINYLRPEFPAVVKYFMELYIDLNINLHGEIPLSPECEGYKGRYIEEQKTDLDKFVNDCLVFDLSGGIYTEVQKAYECYLKYYGLSDESKEALTRNKFVRLLKRDYREIDYRQKKINNYPELVFFNVKLSEQGLQTLNETAPTQQQNDGTLFGDSAEKTQTNGPATQFKQRPPTYTQPPEEPDWDSDPDDPNNEMDIF